MKGRFMDNRFSAEVIGFYYESEDLQVGIFNSNTTTFTLQNAAVALNYGVEITTIFQIDDRWQLRGALSYANLEFDDWEDAGCNPVDSALGAVILATRSAPGCHIGPDGVPIQDMSGEKYGGPPLSVNIGASYGAPVFSGWALDANIDAIHHNKGKEGLNLAGTAIPKRTVVNIAAVLYQQDGPWSVGLTCTNCFDEIYVVGIGTKPLQKINAGVNSDMTASIMPPRLVTLSLTYSLN
jgi:outer membrane receptor protein involved in Fe transport